jgi:hypothetical protein
VRSQPVIEGTRVFEDRSFLDPRTRTPQPLDFVLIRHNAIGPVDVNPRSLRRLELPRGEIELEEEQWIIGPDAWRRRKRDDPAEVFARALVSNLEDKVLEAAGVDEIGLRIDHDGMPPWIPPDEDSDGKRRSPDQEIADDEANPGDKSGGLPGPHFAHHTSGFGRNWGPSE